MEVRGVEPLSESTLTGLSPGADGYCGSLPSCSPPGRQAVTPSGQVRVIMRGRGNSYPPHGRHINDAFPGLWPLRFRRPPLIRQRQQLVCCCLIYKLPIFRMLGASARWSRLHTPVETGTPPRRRSKLRSLHFRGQPPAGRENYVSLRCSSSSHRKRCAAVGGFAALRMRRTPCGCFAGLWWEPWARQVRSLR